MTITPTTEPTIAVDQGLELYRSMFRIRRFETTAGELFAGGKLPGFIHLSLGQEAVATGVCSALDDHDTVSTTHRGHGHCLAKGGDLQQMMAELYGKEGGVTRGRAGSMHASDSSVGILGANGIVGGGIPMAVGSALAAQLDGKSRVSVAFFGDGAVGEGVFTESVNLATLWKLPMIFVCENNGYAELTPTAVHLANTRIIELARPYGIAVEAVDGNDVLAVLAAATRAVERGRRGEGPTLLEMDTTRWHGHFEGDPQRYRSKEELRAMTDRDPVATWRTGLIELGVDAESLDAIEAEVAAEVQAAVEVVELMAPSRADELLRDVYPEGNRA
ncbi:thiamine pyrophosphate-dependent dehydrogenase E1 component subunit alpha [Cryobacterium aureum]|uniref:thiamine pyrophosphate-dependent dehydrogenase E1 component subunit alpha n=1 Tax=Cryobacterium aureum TaxID=995037 RepID=UPI001F0C4C05|nr:thiamine pyrophosphate-dependent dehydrogenase E1 component subunit alpha [Cryobacterium aureum]